MNEEHIRQQFAVRIRKNYDDFLHEWLFSEPEQLVSYAEEIAVTKKLSEVLPKTASIADMDYLLHFENPLAVVRDGWMSCDSGDISQKLKHVIWVTSHNASLWSAYPLSKEHTTTQAHAPLTVREFLEHYPGEAFDMMTPCGYVYVTPESASKLLAGESILGNPGCTGFDMKIPPQELLEQTVASSSYSDGAWHIFSVDSDESEQGQGGMEVTMC